MEKVLIVPDIHGRIFWKNINKYPKEQFPELKIIFLGDYLDPYESLDDISPKEAYDNFLEILDYAKADDRITLLIGNHDWHYFVNLDSCRIDHARERKIENIFKDNIDMFSLVKILNINNTKYIFTHAGITSKWLQYLSDIATNEIAKWEVTSDFPVKEEDPKFIWVSEIQKLKETENYEILNECLKNYNDTFYSCLPSMISRERGGWYPYGSLIWADVYEHLFSKPINGYQIFGHTMPFPKGQFSYSINDNWAMIDASKLFILDDKGKLYASSDTSI